MVHKNTSNFCPRLHKILNFICKIISTIYLQFIYIEEGKSCDVEFLLNVEPNCFSLCNFVKIQPYIALMLFLQPPPKRAGTRSRMQVRVCPRPLHSSNHALVRSSACLSVCPRARSPVDALIMQIGDLPTTCH